MSFVFDNLPLFLGAFVFVAAVLFIRIRQRRAAADAPTQPSVTETETAPAASGKKGASRLPLILGGLLIVVAVTAGAVYLGYPVLTAVAALIGFGLFILRKFRGGTDGVSKRFGREKRDIEDINAEVLAKVQAGHQPHAAPVEAAKEITATEPEDVRDTGADQPKRMFKLSLPRLGRKSKDVAEGAIVASTPEAEPKEKAPKRGLKLKLPSFRRKAKGADNITTTARVKTPRNKQAFETEPLFQHEEVEEKPDLATKLQLLMARFSPAERESKAFAGLPDPFDRLAAETRRSA